MVLQAFREMGYEALGDHELQTVRGNVRIDVWAKQTRTPIPTIILCECKYWSKPVPQSVVYAFRAICSDVGAHFGLIISKAGFQSGASETRQATNIHLLDFAQFQETYFEGWKAGIFMQFAQMMDRMIVLTTHRITGDYPALAEKLVEVQVFDKYGMFFGERSYSKYFIEQGSPPVTVIDPRGDPRERTRITILSHREFYEVACQGFKDAISYFGI